MTQQEGSAPALPSHQKEDCGFSGLVSPSRCESSRYLTLREAAARGGRQQDAEGSQSLLPKGAEL